jgi:PEP-CTERM motif
VTFQSTLAVAALAAVCAQAGPILADNFESYAPGAFPSANWQDVGSIAPSAGQTLPSATVVATTDAFGNSTQALGLADQLAFSRGIYTAAPLSDLYSVTADVRVDRYSDQPGNTVNDWAMELAFAEVTSGTFAGTPQVAVYASSFTQGWRFYAAGAGGPAAEVDLGAAALPGVWYRIVFTFDDATGVYAVTIADILTGAVTASDTGSVSGWSSASGPFDSFAFFGGETSALDTAADQAVIDNISVAVSPEPSTLLLSGIGLAILATCHRKFLFPLFSTTSRFRS